MPLFYHRPTVLTPIRHGRAGLRRGTAAFAAKSIAVPLLAEEFTAAAHSFPIVFGEDARQGALAVVGLRQDQNLFVDEKGAWQNGAYLPAYMRRYPFILLEARETRQFTLCIDETADQFVAELGAGEAGERLFDDAGQPTKVAKDVLDFCGAFQRGYEHTRAMVDAFTSAGVLIERAAEAKLTTGERLGWKDFRVVDRAKLDALPDATILDWRRKGWLEAAYAHLWSLPRWEALMALATSRAA